MTGAIARIIMRYLAGALVAYGYLTPDIGHTMANDPDLVMFVGMGLGLAVEGLYVMAKRFGWSL